MKVVEYNVKELVQAVVKILAKEIVKALAEVDAEALVVVVVVDVAGRVQEDVNLGVVDAAVVVQDIVLMIVLDCAEEVVLDYAEVVLAHVVEPAEMNHYNLKIFIENIYNCKIYYMYLIENNILFCISDYKNINFQKYNMDI